MTRTLNLIIITLVFITAGCEYSSCYRQLIEVDSLTEKDLTDSACKVISTIEKTYYIKDEKEKAYYNLLKYQLQFRNKDKKINDSLIDYSISYYTKHPDTRKLALSYYLKGRTKKDKDAIKFLKKAEFTVQNTDYESLKMRVLNSIAVININNEDYKKALKYELNAIEHGLKSDDIESLISCYVTITDIYSNLGKADSSLFYADKCLSFSEKATDKQKSVIYMNIAANMETVDTAKAREYAWKSIKAKPTNNAYQILAKLARDRKDYALSETYLNEALKYCKALDWEAFIIHELAQTKELMGKHEEANILSNKVIKLRDSVEYLRAQDSIKETQVAAELDNENRNEIKEKDHRTAMITTVLTIIIVITATAYVSRRRKHKKSVESMEMLEKDMEKHISTAEKQMNEYRNEIRKMKEENREKERKMREERKDMRMQVEKIRTDAAKQMKQENEYYHEGYNIYNKVKNGDETIKWGKTEMKSLVAFYRRTYPDIKTNTDGTVDKLTEYQYVMLIMRKMGLSNKKIAKMLKVTESAVRTMMSRIKKAVPSDAPKGGEK